MAYDNTNRGALFKNEKKAENHPDYKGSINVGGVDFWLSAWIKRTEEKTYMSLSVQPKEAKPAPKKQQDDDDQIPF